MSTRGRRNEPTDAGRWLRRQREQRGISTQAELARQLGWDKTAVNNYETRGVEVPNDRARQLAEFFGLDEIEVRRNLGLWVPDKATGRREPPTDEELRASALKPETAEAIIRMRKRIARWIAEGDETLIRQGDRLTEAIDEERDAG